MASTASHRGVALSPKARQDTVAMGGSRCDCPGARVAAMLTRVSDLARLVDYAGRLVERPTLFHPSNNDRMSAQSMARKTWLFDWCRHGWKRLAGSLSIARLRANA